MLLPGLTHLASDFGNLRCFLCPPTAVFQSWLCFQGECKDLGLVKGTETNLSPLLLGRYSLLESLSLSFRKHWGLNTIYSRCTRSQILIFLWLLFSQKKFMLLLISVAPSCCVARAPHQPGGSQELCRFLAQLSCWLKLDPEARNGMEVPTKQLSLKCLHCYPLRETWRAAESVLFMICHYF